jgi:hypothetical protein
MEQEQEIIKDPKLKDIAYSWVDSSVFLFYLQVFCIIALIIGGSYGLYVHRYMGKPNVSVPPNTLYTPQYK